MANLSQDEWRESILNLLHVDPDNSPYASAQLNRAIQRFVNHYHMIVGEDWTIDETLTTTASDEDLDMSGLTNFKAYRVKYMRIQDSDSAWQALRVISRDEMLRDLARNDESGLPDTIAFTTDTDALLNPVPDDTYTVRTVYAKGLGTWGPSSVINVDEEFARPIIEACAAYVGAEDPTAFVRSRQWEAFDAWCRTVKGMIHPPSGSRLRDPAAYSRAGWRGW